MAPSFNNFKGIIIKIDNKNYLSKGKYEVLNDVTIRITELPIGKWTDDYKKFLDSLLPEVKKSKSLENEDHKKKKEKKTIIDYVNNSSDTDIDLTITLPQGFLNSLQWDEDPNIDGIEKFFKLTTTKGLSLKNIHLYNNEGHIKKYHNLPEIFDEFYSERYSLYVKRKEYQLDNLRNELIILVSKKNFMNDVMNEKIIIYKRKKVDIIQDLFKMGIVQVSNGKCVDTMDSNETTSNYDYLIKMSLYLFTEDEIEKLEKEIQRLQLEYFELEKKTIEEIWIGECDKLLKYV
mgnify:CR=1 FL=1